MDRDQRPLVIAHRGSSGTAPENTITALSHAIAQGADAVECDVRLSKDNEVVVFHDATLRRTTDGRGYVRDHSVQHLKQFDAGSWFASSFAGERIPTLAETLEFVNGRIGINIELKSVREVRNSRELVNRCLEEIERSRALEYVLITSFQHSLLQRVKGQNPNVTVGVLYHPLLHAGQSPSRLARQVGAKVFVCSLRFLRRRMVADAHRCGIAVAAYTINTKQHLQRCLALGLDGVVTNFPGRMRELYHDPS